MIVDTTNQIDVAFGAAGTTLPITDSKVLGLLGIRAAREVAYQCMTVRGVYATDQQPPLWTGWHKEFEEMLKAIADGTIVSVTSGTIKPSLGVPDQEPAFTRDMIL